MRFRSSILMAGMLSASLFCAENLTQAKVEQSQSDTVRPAVSATMTFAAALLDYGIEAQRIVSAHSLGVGGKTIQRAAPDCDAAKVNQR